LLQKFGASYLQQRYDPLQMRFTGKVMHGILYYAATALKSNDKSFSQGYRQAQKSLMTRSIVQGRGGGLKLLSDMDKSAVLASNAPFVCKEVLMQHSDGYKVFICQNCNRFSQKDLQTEVYLCNNCPQSPQILTNISYANLQVQRILFSFGIDLRFIPEKQIHQIIEDQVNKQVKKTQRKQKNADEDSKIASSDEENTANDKFSN
jgi:hypothetical protein